MEPKTVSLLGVPMDLGAGLRGVDMGPSALRIAGIGPAIEALGHRFRDRGSVQVARPEDRLLPVEERESEGNAHFLPEITDCCRRVRDRVGEILAAGEFPFVVGGDHSIAAGTVAGVARHYHERGHKIGLIWFDAHADMNSPEISPSGNVHGMPLAAILGYGPRELGDLGPTTPMVDAKNVVLIGIRDVDENERRRVREAGVHAYTMRELDILGMDRVMREALKHATDGTVGFHISFDLDGMDPSEAPGTGTPVPGGMTLREAHLFMEHAAESGQLLSLEMTEINPILDEKNRTAALAVDMAQSALGKRILR
ncbi:MAG: arginase [Planctomycetota bacterium]